MPDADRSSGDQRLYPRAVQDRVAFIRHAHELGFPLDAIRDFLSLCDRPGQSCAEVDAIARAQLIAVEGRITRVQALKGELERMVDHCAGGTI